MGRKQYKSCISRISNIKTMTAKTLENKKHITPQYHTTPPKAKHASTNPETKGNMNLKTLNINARLVNGKLNT